MMEKLLHYPGADPVTGQPFLQVVSPGSLEKTADAETLCPEMQKFIASLQPQEGHTYVLNNALGSFEYYGANINGDSFPEEALLNGHEAITAIDCCDVEARVATAQTIPYGYPTFYTASIFTHHVNKQPEKSLGRIIMVAWNERMHRVEVLFDLDHEKCRAQDAYWVIEQICAGKFPATSMGCKVPDDRCSICGNRAKTRHDYCEHVNNQNPAFGMGKVLPDGRVCCVHNDQPRFFDDSFVLIGADKTAKVMAKIASGLAWFMSGVGFGAPSAERGEAYYGGGEMSKTASYKEEFTAGTRKASLPFTRAGEEQRQRLRAADSADASIKEARIKKAYEKFSEMMKQVPGLEGGKLIHHMAAREPDIPSNTLNQLADQAPSLRAALAAPSACGMVLKPHEFQRVVLRHGGMGPLADHYDNQGLSFTPSMQGGGFPQQVGSVPIPVVMQLVGMLLGMVQSRSIAPPVMRRRIIMSFRPQPMIPAPAEASDPMLDKLAHAYYDYRSSALEAAPFMAAAWEQPQIKEAIFRQDVLDLRAGIKTASVSSGDLSMAMRIIPMLAPAVYLNSAHLKAKQESGEKLGIVGNMIAKHPTLVAALAMGAGQLLLSDMAGAQAASNHLA